DKMLVRVRVLQYPWISSMMLLVSLVDVGNFGKATLVRGFPKVHIEELSPTAMVKVSEEDLKKKGKENMVFAPKHKRRGKTEVEKLWDRLGLTLKSEEEFHDAAWFAISQRVLDGHRYKWKE
ncbi:hypothetical protein A2U01_0009803, partial [Trifolium medium]|nr:hypothetical protein [Trifolium medium]